MIVSVNGVETVNMNGQLMLAGDVVGSIEGSNVNINIIELDSLQDNVETLEEEVDRLEKEISRLERVITKGQEDD